jgi:dTDP-4-amino-4,6-dideoxygalactose transaminase
MTGQISLSTPDVGPLEEQYLQAALRSGWAAPVGPDLEAFERELAERTGTGYAVALNSGTAALHLALLGLGVGPGQLVVVPTLTFAATANAVTYTGAEPVFVDCEPATGNLDVGLLAELLAGLRREAAWVTAVLPVDMYGSCADYHRLLPVCAAAGVPVVADAAESLGASYAGRPAGSYGRAAALSFNGNKVLTTGGGGALVSDDRDLIDHCRYLATQARQPVAHYEHTDIGYNYRLSNLLSALGRAQLRRLTAMIARRRQIRDRYAKLFAPVPGVRLLAAEDDGANCWLTTIIVEPAAAGWRAGDLAGHLEARQIETRPVWKPMHLQPVFVGARGAITGAAEQLFATGLALPSSSALTEPQVGRILDTIRDFLEGRQ